MRKHWRPLPLVAGERDRRKLLAKPDAKPCVRTEATGQRVLNTNSSLRRILFRTGADSSHPHTYKKATVRDFVLYIYKENFAKKLTKCYFDCGLPKDVGPASPLEVGRNQPRSVAMRKGFRTLLAAMSCALGVSLVSAEERSEVGLVLEPDNCRMLARQWVGNMAGANCFGVNLGLALRSRMSAHVHTGLQLTGYSIRYRYDEVAFSELRVQPLRWGRGKEYFVFISHNLKF